MDGASKNCLLTGEPGAALDLLRLKGVHKRYGRGIGCIHALHDINLQVAVGEMVAVCGPCGSGKTSLLNVIGLLEPASEGSVTLAQLLVAKLSEQARADLRSEMLGYVFQSFSLIPVLTALENVMLPLMLRGRLNDSALAAAHARAADLLAQVGLNTQAGHYPAKLDPSQSQRVAIARALMTQPRLVVADEPTSRLDHGAIRLVMDMFARQQQAHATAFVISCRDQRQLNRVTRTLQLVEGRLAAQAGTERKTYRVQG